MKPLLRPTAKPLLCWAIVRIRERELYMRGDQGNRLNPFTSDYEFPIGRGYLDGCLQENEDDAINATLCAPFLAVLCVVIYVRVQVKYL